MNGDDAPCWDIMYMTRDFEKLYSCLSDEELLNPPTIRAIKEMGIIASCVQREVRPISIMTECRKKEMVKRGLYPEVKSFITY